VNQEGAAYRHNDIGPSVAVRVHTIQRRPVLANAIRSHLERDVERWIIRFEKRLPVGELPHQSDVVQGRVPELTVALSDKFRNKVTSKDKQSIKAKKTMTSYEMKRYVFAGEN